MLLPGERVDDVVDVVDEAWPADGGEGVEGALPLRQSGQDLLQELGHARQALRHTYMSSVKYTNIYKTRQIDVIEK